MWDEVKVLFIPVIQLGTVGDNSPSVYNCTSSKINSVQLSQMCPQLVNCMICEVELALNSTTNLVPIPVMGAVGLHLNSVSPKPTSTANNPLRVKYSPPRPYSPPAQNSST